MFHEHVICTCIHACTFTCTTPMQDHVCIYTVQTFDSCTSRPDVCRCMVVQTLIEYISRNKPNTSMTSIASESKLRLVTSSSMYPCPGNWVAFGRAVVYYARASHAFSAGIKCRHCILQAKWIQTKHIMYPFNLDRVLPYLLFVTPGSVLRKMRHQMATICIWYKQFHWHVTNIAYVNTLSLEKALIISNLDHVLYLPSGFVT